MSLLARLRSLLARLGSLSVRLGSLLAHLGTPVPHLGPLGLSGLATGPFLGYLGASLASS